MKWSMKLGRIAGIDVYVHATFALLIAVLAISGLSAGLLAALVGVIFVLLVFGCVLLHELGHALAARRYGIKTRDIVLLPIGGVARLERMPDQPQQELVVALAGPAVNVAIAAVLFLLGGVLGAVNSPVQPALSGALVDRLLWANLILVGFNMIPAFPMDGGRVLRALLAMKKPHAEATAIAAQVGKAFAVLFGLWGLVTGNLLLVVLAVFVFMAAGAEARFSKTRTALSGARAVDAALTSYRCLSTESTLQDAADELMSTSQRDFPVLDAEGRLVGLLTQSDLAAAFPRSGPWTSILGVARRSFPIADPDQPLEIAMEHLQASGLQTMPLVRGGRLVGLLTLENIAAYLMLRGSGRSGPGGPAGGARRPMFSPPPPPPGRSSGMAASFRA